MAEPIFCEMCGHSVPDGDAFCGLCGYPVRTAAKASDPEDTYNFNKGSYGSSSSPAPQQPEMSDSFGYNNQYFTAAPVPSEPPQVPVQPLADVSFSRAYVSEEPNPEDEIYAARADLNEWVSRSVRPVWIVGILAAVLTLVNFGLSLKAGQNNPPLDSIGLFMPVLLFHGVYMPIFYALGVAGITLCLVGVTGRLPALFTWVGAACAGVVFFLSLMIAVANFATMIMSLLLGSEGILIFLRLWSVPVLYLILAVLTVRSRYYGERMSQADGYVHYAKLKNLTVYPSVYSPANVYASRWSLFTGISAVFLAAFSLLTIVGNLLASVTTGLNTSTYFIFGAGVVCYVVIAWLAFLRRSWPADIMMGIAGIGTIGIWVAYSMKGAWNIMSSMVDLVSQSLPAAVFGTVILVVSVLPLVVGLSAIYFAYSSYSKSNYEESSSERLWLWGLGIVGVSGIVVWVMWSHLLSWLFVTLFIDPSLSFSINGFSSIGS